MDRDWGACGTILKNSNICVIRVSEEKQKKIFEEILAEKVSNTLKNISVQICEDQKTLNKIKPKKSMPIIKLLKDKDQEIILKSARGKLRRQQ